MKRRCLLVLFFLVFAVSCGKTDNGKTILSDEDQSVIEDKENILDSENDEENDLDSEDTDTDSENTDTDTDESEINIETVTNLLSVGLFHSCAITFDSKVYCWGLGNTGQLGNYKSGYDQDEFPYFSPTPVEVDSSLALNEKKIISISSGSNHTCALDLEGRVYCWGAGGSGQLGDGISATSGNDDHFRDFPISVNTTMHLKDKKLISISAGGSHTCGIDIDGAAYCWGDGMLGQIGRQLAVGSTLIDSSYPVDVDMSGVLNGKKLAQISAGGAHTCALDTKGKAYCWGLNEFLELGDGKPPVKDEISDFYQSNIPVEVDMSLVPGGKFVFISAGGSFTCALDTEGKAYCWGEGLYGQLGNGKEETVAIPTPIDTTGVLNGKKLVSVDCGNFYSCAMDDESVIFCWGEGGTGQLGNGTDESSLIPVTVENSSALKGKELVSVAAGGGYYYDGSYHFYGHTCTVDKDFSFYCWGDNSIGQLGNNDTKNTSTPVLVVFTAE